MKDPSRTLWAMALLIAVPPAIGVYLAVLRVLGSRSHLVAVSVALATFIGLGGAVVLLGTTGQVGPTRRAG